MRYQWRHVPYFYLVAGLLSLLMTGLVLAYQQPFNFDGIRYLQAAVAFTHGAWLQGAKASSWPFYSLLIAGISNSTHLSLLNAAYVLNAILDVITVIAFVRLIGRFGGSRKTQWLGLFVILFFPYFNHLRDHLVRGHGYYAFGLIAMLMLINYMQQQRWRIVLGWSLSIMVAVLFRIEGVVLLALAPLVVFTLHDKSWRQRLLLFIKLNALFILLAIVALLGLLLTTHQWGNLQAGRWHQLLAYGFNAWQTAAWGLQKGALAVKAHVIPSMGYGDERAFTLGGLFGMYVAKLSGVFDLIYLVLIGYAIKYLRRQLVQECWRVWLSFILINLLITAVFIMQNFFMVQRYLGLMAIVGLLLAPFAIEYLYGYFWQISRHYSNHSRRPFCHSRAGGNLALLLLSLALLYVVIDAAGHFGPNKNYIVRGGQWLKQHVVSKQVVLASDPVLLYYSGQNGQAASLVTYPNGIPTLNKGLLQSLPKTKFHYLIFDQDRHLKIVGKQLTQYLQRQPVKVINDNGRGSKVLIYHLGS